MADNIATTVNAAIATDDINGVHYQRMKMVIGADGVNDGDVSAANPLPVVFASMTTIDDSTPIDVAITNTVPISVAVPLVIDDSTPIDVAGPLTDTQLRATAVPVSLAQTVNTSEQTTASVERIDVASTTITYFGSATPGTLTNAAGWRIQRMSVSGTVTTFEYADGNTNFDNIWDNRASLTYL